MPTSLRLIMTAVNAALYAGVGALWTVFPLTVFGVRFWPQVFIPAAFSAIFGPWVGGVGAGIGIFVADVLYGHHDALLSLLVGVPSNFLGFFVIGWLTGRDFAGITRRVLVFVSVLIPVVLIAYGIYLLSGASVFANPQLMVVTIGVICVAGILPVSFIRNRWAWLEVAASIGLGIGSVIIGLGLVLYSYIFALPAVLGLGKGGLPISFLYAVTTFTYVSEIPFIVIFTPPVVAASKAAFPGLGSTESR